MIYTIKKFTTSIRVTPAVPSEVRIEIEFGFRLAEVEIHHFGAGDSNEFDTCTLFQMVDETATDTDVEMVRQILLRNGATAI